MKNDHSPDLPNILSRSKLQGVSQPVDGDHHFFANLQRNSRVRADSDSFQTNSDKRDSSFQPQTTGNNGSVERRPFSVLQVQSPDVISNHSDDR